MFVKILRWVLFGVVLSIIPFTLVVIRNWVIDHKVLELEYLLDLLLITFAIAVNALSLITDNEKQIRMEMRVLFGIVSGVSMLICIAMYFSFYEDCLLNDKLLEQIMTIEYSAEDISLNEDAFQKLELTKQMIAELSPKSERLVMLIKFSMVILLINGIIGLVVEIVAGYCEKKQQSNQCKDSSNKNEA